MHQLDNEKPETEERKVALYRDTYADDMFQLKLPMFFDDDNAIEGAVTIRWHKDYWHYTE